jgi:hypothetical protein
VKYSKSYIWVGEYKNMAFPPEEKVILESDLVYTDGGALAGPYAGGPEGASGAGAGSGTSGFSLSGPWFIEEQDLTLAYLRVPGAYLASASVTLSGVNAGFAFSHTALACQCEARYRRRKEYGVYQTSAYQQPQRFELLAISADPQGQTYGASGGFSASTLGPMGIIRTKQRWIHRRPWLEGVDTEITRIMPAAYNVGLGKDVSGVAAFIWEPAIARIADYRRYLITPGVAGSLLDGNESFYHWFNPLGWKPGPYSYTQDVTSDIWTLLDAAGWRVTSVNWAIGWPTGPGPVLTLTPSNLDGFSEYSVSRHTYAGI